MIFPCPEGLAERLARLSLPRKRKTAAKRAFCFIIGSTAENSCGAETKAADELKPLWTRSMKHTVFERKWMLILFKNGQIFEGSSRI